MFTYADQVGQKIKEDKIQKNIEKCLLTQARLEKIKENKI